MDERQITPALASENRMCNILSLSNQYTMEVPTT